MSYAGGQPNETNPRWTAVDHYSFSHLHPPSSTSPTNRVLDAAVANSEKHGLPNIAVSPCQGKFLMLHAQLLRAQNVLEVGTLGGYSTIWLASASPDIRVTTVEVDERHAAIARENLAAAGVADRVEVIVGSGMDVLPKLVKEVQSGARGKFDLVFIDADKENNWAYVDHALGMCVQGACIIVDNVVRKGRLVDSSTTDSRVLGARKVVEEVGKDERLDGVVLQTVGKSYDGFLMAIAK